MWKKEKEKEEKVKHAKAKERRKWRNGEQLKGKVAGRAALGSQWIEVETFLRKRNRGKKLVPFRNQQREMYRCDGAINI